MGLFSIFLVGTESRLGLAAGSYVALMSDPMLTRLGVTTGDLVVEGSFAANPVSAALLAAFRPSQPVFRGLRRRRDRARRRAAVAMAAAGL